ncbi:hypothetical protein PSPTO_4388 [Pseudomonas syringae pv. tomato str. DC3000]|uniref:Uncharacterized protein n=1 Tax=Pseudomonas syringae pv. tomato (strain ATCC BAA-871 / DC3000) TaxID=223283 RepID=Q87X02_PSESM|nr:hypothetical protein PSPTO_4388 [Pseudomonas syringae pv. tomato str. DC3000]
MIASEGGEDRSALSDALFGQRRHRLDSRTGRRPEEKPAHRQQRPRTLRPGAL